MAFHFSNKMPILWHILDPDMIVVRHAASEATIGLAGFLTTDYKIFIFLQKFIS